MTDQDKPRSLNYTIEPLFNAADEVQSLRIEVIISEPALKNQDILLVAPVEITKVDVGHFENELMARDGNGDLQLIRVVDDYGKPIVYQSWKVSRSTNGPVTVSYTALPREVNTATKNAPSFDLRKSFGGVLGSGFGFLVVPPTNQLELEYDASIRWNLTNSPPGTQAVWSLGEGSSPPMKRLKAVELSATYFMVGSIHSFADAMGFGVYWFESPPFDTTEIAKGLYRMFRRMSTFFKDDDKTYRVFIRYNPFPGSMAGTALTRSFMFSYDEEDCAHPRTFQEYLLFLAHECVHNWVHLDYEDSDNWYPEGMAEYYSLFLSYENKILSKEELRVALNRRLTSYYTNPFISLSNAEISKLTWKSSDAQRMPYGRGLVFILKLNKLIAANSDATHAASIDDLVLTMLDLSRERKPCGISEFINELGQLIDGGKPTAKSLYDSMTSGMMTVPSEDSLQHLGLELKREDARIWELGFDESAAIQSDRVISELVPGSMAAMAGLQNGDRILNEMKLDDAKSEPEGVLHLIIEREDQGILQFSFVPRGNKVVERWIYLDMLSTDDMAQFNEEL